MSRTRSAREESYALAGLRWPDLRASVHRHLPTAEPLRRAVPFLIAAFVALAAAGLASQLVHGKRAALTAAEAQMALIADIAVSRLADQSLSSTSGWQSALAASLPKGATAEGRVAKTDQGYCLANS